MTHRVGRLAVHEPGSGAGPTLVLLHGLSDSGRCWDDLVERLGATYRLVAPDALGHGSSDRFAPEELADPGTAMSETTELLLEELADDGPVLVLGHSMGGAVAADLAARRPELVRAVVLEDPAWMAPESLEQRRADADLRVAGVRETVADLDAAMATCRVEHPTWPESELPGWAQGKGDLDLDFLATGLAVPPQPWQQVVAALTAPTLVVTGDDVVLLDQAVRQEIAALGNPAVEVEVVPGAGHCVRRDRGDAFHALVDPWLRLHAPA